MNQTELEVLVDNEKPFVDFTQQAKYCEEYLRIEDKIFEKLQKI